MTRPFISTKSDIPIVTLDLATDTLGAARFLPSEAALARTAFVQAKQTHAGS